MSILASLNKAYDRLAKSNKVPTYGFATQNIHACIVLNNDGSVSGPPALWNKDDRGKNSSRMMQVPYFGGRSGKKPPPYFLWDNTAYVLGVTLKDFDPTQRHDEFKKLHLSNLENCEDEGLAAIYKFLSSWKPEKFYEIGFNDELKDKNLVFRLNSKQDFVHEGVAAKALWERICPSDTVGEGTCLVSGLKSQITRLHPPIGSFENPARIVSFNQDAYYSYGHTSGDNAPVSTSVAFRYSATLNYFLEKNSDNKIQIGDASTVFWADASDAALAEQAENIFMAMFDEAAEAKHHIRPILEKIRMGQPVHNFAPRLSDGVRFYVLGLAPNAARLSIRFWFEGDFGKLAENYQRFISDMRIEPPDRDDAIALWKYLSETAVLGKAKNVPPNLAGEWMRSILAGSNYPMTLLSTVLMRIRADKNINARRVSILKAILIRNLKSKEAPVALDPNYPNPAYHLGRLFAVLENFQKAALGEINRTIRDGYFSTAMTAPASVFSRLIKLNSHHRSKAIKENPNWAKSLEIQMSDITNALPPNIPSTLSLADQSLFTLGYFHQANRRKATDATAVSTKGNNQ